MGPWGQSRMCEVEDRQGHGVVHRLAHKITKYRRDGSAFVLPKQLVQEQSGKKDESEARHGGTKEILFLLGAITIQF